MSDGKKQYPDPLVRQRLFPDPSRVFDFAPVELKDALAGGIVVVDTNVLLVPYTTGRASLEQIRRTYETLTLNGQLRIPGQVAREFAENRAEKLKTLFQQLSRKREVALSRSEYPLLEGIQAYADVCKREAEITASITEYKKAVGDLLETVAAWHWNDPVSLLYRELFKPPLIVDLEIDRDELLNELKYRQEHRVPPGYKDASNEYSGVGDLLIWRTLLMIGRQESRHLVFVSGDEKTDWRYQSENTALFPRFELIDEYRAASNGMSLLIISFAELLKQFGAPPPVVEQVRQEEAVASLAARTSSLPSAVQQSAHRARQAVLRWLIASNPGCRIVSNQSRTPDLVLLRGDVSEGYQIKYIHDLKFGTQRRLRDLVQQLATSGASAGFATNIVVVAEVGPERDLEYIFGMLDRLPLTIWVPTIILGALNSEGEFEERARMGLAGGK